MATYAIGDIQGCYDPFRSLLDELRFDPACDRLWLVGDLVNRGPDSLAVLRFVRKLGEAAVTVLGNHDLHLLAIVYGGHTPTPSDTFEDVLAAPDLDELAGWLRTLPLLVHDDALRVVMTHAGIPHIWTLERAAGLAAEVAAVMAAGDHRSFFRDIYGNRPDIWHDDLAGMDRLRVVTNYLTRMRLVAADGRMEFAHKGPPEHMPAGYRPWFEYDAWVGKKSDHSHESWKIVFGHWASLDGHADVPGVYALDTGCVWGRKLTALCLESLVKTSFG